MRELRISERYILKHGNIVDLLDEGEFIVTPWKVFVDEETGVAKVHGIYVDAEGKEYENYCLSFRPSIDITEDTTADEIMESAWEDILIYSLE